MKINHRLAFAALLGALCCGALAQAPPAPGSPLPPGAIAPDFVMKDVAGKDVRLSDFKGKVVILDFWATWCAPCIASFPHTQEIAARYKDQGLVVLASGTSDTIARFKEWIPKNQAKYPDLVFAYDLNERGSASFEERVSSRLYGVQGIPSQFVIGRDGRIAGVVVGNEGREDARTELALSLAGLKVDEATVAKGRAQAAKAEEQEKALAAEEARRPPFLEDFGELKSGDKVPDLTLGGTSGEPVKLSSFLGRKALVIGLWDAAGGPPPPMLETWESWGAKYRDQGVRFIGVAAHGSLDDVGRWRAQNAGKFSFPVVWDPVGPPPTLQKPFDELNDEERKAFGKAQQDYFEKTFALLLSGGAMPMSPTIFVFDAEGKFVGWTVGFGPDTPEALGLMLMRAGVTLAPEDRPKKIRAAGEKKASSTDL